uniref:Uncharacterized protein n=1 Tax=Arundo donax TaxID=35708 RepID=A0A0A9BIG9_ARUDO
MISVFIGSTITFSHDAYPCPCVLYSPCLLSLHVPYHLPSRHA